MSHSFSTCGPGLPSLMPLSQLLADAPDDDDDDYDGGDDDDDDDDDGDDDMPLSQFKLADAPAKC